MESIKRVLRERNLRQVDLADHLGIIPNKVSLSLAGKRRFTADERDKIRAWLFGPEKATAATFRPIPIIGQVAAGNWREAVERSMTSIPSPDPSVPPRAFGLRVSGDSMDEYVEDGGTVIVDPDDKALFPGRFYVVLNGDGEATFKKFAADPARLVPCSTNPAHTDILIGSGEQFSIVGRVIWRASRM